MRNSMRSSLTRICLAGLILAAAVPARPARADQAVTFDSARYLVGELQQRLARERGEPLNRAPAETIQGYLSKPAGAGPFPAVVHLHGCGGLAAQRRISAGEQFASWGYVALVVDSFATRGIKQACTGGPQVAREADALGALVYLSRLPFVDAKRIAVVGFSQGGTIALELASVQPVELFEMPKGLTFKAAAAFYPMCSAATDQLAIPTIVLTGALDDWALAAECDRFMRRRDGKGAPVTMTVFPGVYHSFDSLGAGDGVRYFGHWLKYDADATRRSSAAMHDFLAAQLGK